MKHSWEFLGHLTIGFLIWSLLCLRSLQEEYTPVKFSVLFVIYGFLNSNLKELVAIPSRAHLGDSFSSEAFRLLSSESTLRCCVGVNNTSVIVLFTFSNSGSWLFFETSRCTLDSAKSSETISYYLIGTSSSANLIVTSEASANTSFLDSFGISDSKQLTLGIMVIGHFAAFWFFSTKCGLMFSSDSSLPLGYLVVRELSLSWDDTVFIDLSFLIMLLIGLIASLSRTSIEPSSMRFLRLEL